MKTLGTTWALLCVIFGYITVVAEADPNENFEAIVGPSADYVTKDFFNLMLEKLHTVLPNLEECFTHETFHDLFSEEGGLSKNEFFNVSRAITNIVADKGCSGNVDTSRIPDGHKVVESLRNLSYHGLHDTASCFGEETLERESGDGLTTAVVLYLYQGYCLLPEKDYFTSEYMKFFSNADGSSTKESFENFVQLLRIGEQQSHDGHDHGTGDGHDHEGHSHTDDQAHDNHDHDDHAGNGTDTDHDNHDHHESNGTDTDHHDHDHHESNGTDTDHDDHDHHESNGTDTDHHDHDHHESNGTDTDRDDHDHHECNGTDTDHHDHDDHESNGTDTDHHDHDHHESNGTDTHDADHDHVHSRRKRSSHEEEAPRCYTGDQLAEIYGLGSTISESQALEICPALIQQILSGACNSTEDSHGIDKAGYTQAMIYGYGTLAVAIISLLAVLGLLLFPVLESDGYKMTMQFFIGLAIGTMAADALIHIIPKILGVHVHGAHDNHNHAAGEEDMTFVWQMSLVLGGLYLVFFFENLLKTIKRSRRTKGGSNSDDSEETIGGNGSSTNDAATFDDMTTSKRKMGSKSTLDSDVMLNEQNIICWFFNPTLITVFFGDVLHNFADGVAIGVAFASHWSTGISTSIAILCHELPHEFGDFAIYLRNGATKWQAIGLNFTAACCAFIGLYSGINMASDEDVRKWLLCIIAGIFLYISLVQVMSLMLREVSDRPILVFFIQNAGMLIGWVILLIIALYEGSIRVGA